MANLADNPEAGSSMESNWRRLPEVSVLTSTEGVVYEPKTTVTRAAYETMLSVIQQQLGGQPLDIVRDAADKILAVLKNDTLKNPEKKRDIKKMLNSISNHVFDQLVFIGKHITDFDVACSGEDALDDDLGVKVEFEDDEKDDHGSHFDNVQDDDINVQDIDAYWLQSKISQAYDQQIDPQHSETLVEEVLQILEEGYHDHAVETKLLVHLGFDKGSLVKYLLRNRIKILWCTRLARAEDQEQRKQIEEKMMELDLNLVTVLEQSHATRASVKERQNNIEKRILARCSKDDNGGFSEDRYKTDIDTENDWLNGQHQLLDLESITLQQGGLLYKKCEFSLGLCSKHNNGYEEVHVPPLKAKPFAEDDKLVTIAAMPGWAQEAFKGVTHLNRVESRVYKTALFTAENLLLCAPTGAKKTNVAILTILHQLGLHRNENDTYNHSGYKIVYVAPMKAIVDQVVRNLSKRLKPYGVTVMELGGHQSLTWRQIKDAQIIVTTPEEWDITIRKSRDCTYIRLVDLLIIDEIHLLHDKSGPVLESIVARTVRQMETTNKNIRLVGLSATFPNFQDVAVFMRVDVNNGLFHFDDSYRHCPLAQHYIGITVKKPLQRFQLMNDICYEKVLGAAGKHQVLIFVHSEKETTKTAHAIRDAALANNTLGAFLKDDDRASREILQDCTKLVKSDDLKDLLPYGLAMHNAGMAKTDCHFVEKLFADGHIQVLVSTVTLAWGADLSAHTVIIKGTQMYSSEKGSWTELTPLVVMQMLGLAGRPQFDTYGEGIIITGHNELQYYLSVMNGHFRVESQFVSKLADQLDAEIVLGTVQNINEAVHWLGYTYLYSCMVRNPTFYGLSHDVLDTDKLLLKRRADLVHSAATILEKNNLVKYDRNTGSFQATDLGRIASHCYVTYRTIATYNEHLNPTMSVIELCQLFSHSEEFKYVTVGQDEKMELAKLLDRVPYPIKENLEDPTAKINVLLQAYISQIEFESLSLTSDMVFIAQTAVRLMLALFEIGLKRGWAQLAENALILCKNIHRRIWSVNIPLQQFFGRQNEILMKLEKKNRAWKKYYEYSSEKLGKLVGDENLGRALHEWIRRFPKLKLAADVRPITRTTLIVILTITPDFQWEDGIHGYGEPFWVLVENNAEEIILHREYFVLQKNYIGEDHTLIFTVPIYEPLPPLYFIKVFSEKWLGCVSDLSISFRSLILPEKDPPPTELPDLQPLSVTVLRNSLYVALYKKFKYFNPVQTQVFRVLYNTDDNVLVAAPMGSGKTICAEFAILKNHKKGPDVMRVVYIAPVEALAKERYKEWKKRFGDGLGLEVSELTGETDIDVRILEKGQVIISTPHRWDALSRHRKHWQLIQKVSLFIVDELHLVGVEGGSVLEVIVSRMRYIASKGHSIRIVALSASLADAKDLGEWIGAMSQNIFNFPQVVRPVPLEVHIQGIDIANFEATMQAMSKPTYTAIVQHAKNKKPAIVFVPTRKYVQQTAIDLMTYSSAAIKYSGAEGGEKQPLFLLQSENELGPFIDRIKEPILKETLRYGVGYLHKGLTTNDQDIVEKLYESGCIQICVMSSTMCWGSSLRAYLVILLGTQYYDSREKMHINYPVTDVLKMVGHASRPLVDKSGKCVIFCHAPCKEYYEKFLSEPFPVESILQPFLHDNLNAEVVLEVIKNREDAVEYLTTTFMYRRFTRNPNYYFLDGVSERHISDRLSVIVNDVMSDLKASKCVTFEQDFVISPLPLGEIASYGCISFTTIERFSSYITSKTKLKGLLEILASASEYESLLVRTCDEDLIRRLNNHQRFENAEYSNPHVKANALLLAHLSRSPVCGMHSVDQQEVLLNASRLLEVLIDIISSKGWLNLALLAMQVSQMVTQGLWEQDSILLQLPHFTEDLAKHCEENPGKSIKTVFDLVEMEDVDRRNLLQMSDPQLMDIAKFCNRYPKVSLSYQVEVTAGNIIKLTVRLRPKDETEGGPVDAPRYPKAKKEMWWLVVGNTASNCLVAINKFSLQEEFVCSFDFTPSEPGKVSFTLFLKCDSYLGCDQEYSFTVEVKRYPHANTISI